MGVYLRSNMDVIAMYDFAYIIFVKKGRLILALPN